MKPKKSRKERRNSSRHKTRALVHAECGGRHFRLGNLSVSGAFLRTENPLSVGTALKLRLRGERLPDPIEVATVVRRQEPGIGMGVEFTQFHGSDQMRLQELLANISVARILVVDDDEQIRQILSIALKRENYEVVTAADGVEGLQMALELRPDLVILDLAMPGLPGLEVCQRLRAAPSLAQVPILVLSASTDITDISAAQQLGAVMFAPKPFKMMNLLSHIRMLLER